jgi:hypothetical protein
MLDNFVNFVHNEYVELIESPWLHFPPLAADELPRLISGFIPLISKNSNL